MTTTLINRLEAAKTRLAIKQSQQDMEDQAGKVEAIASRIEDLVGQVAEMAGTVRRCAKQITPERRSATSNWSRVREHFETISDEVESIPVDAKVVSSSQYAQKFVKDKRPPVLDKLEAALRDLWADHVKGKTGSLRATLELVKLVPDWAGQSAETNSLIAQLAAWERKTPSSDADLESFERLCKDADISVKKLNKLLPKENQRQFLKKLQSGEATLAEALSLLDWLEDIKLADQLLLCLQSQQPETPSPQVQTNPFNRARANRRW